MFSAVGQRCLERRRDRAGQLELGVTRNREPWYFLASWSTLPAFSVTAIEFTNLN